MDFPHRLQDAVMEGIPHGQYGYGPLWKAWART